MAAVPNTTETPIYTLPGFEISTDEVLRELQSLTTNKSPGPDKSIQNYSKKYQEVLSPLSMLFIMSLQHRIIPSDWKLVNVTPI